ncbi:hypothetical protein ACQHIV_37795 [Kribbella sp. GL6]|uniref:hypothetical protein n=1 Tax=Kribbella sp. GL6 TaxID=3419765 RepID=UPI003CFC2382
MTDIVDDGVWAVEDLSASRRVGLKNDLLTRINREERRHRQRVAGGVAASVVAVAGAAVAAMLTFVPTASASWTAVPAPLAISLDDPMVQQCLADLPDRPVGLVGKAQLVPVAAEKRGTSRAALLGGSDSQAICLEIGKSRGGGRTLSPALPPGHEISVAGNGGAIDAGSGDRYVYGRVSRRVMTVSVVTTTGLHVTASVAQGAYLAWWPGGSAPATLVAEDANHQVIATMKMASR